MAPFLDGDYRLRYSLDRQDLTRIGIDTPPKSPQVNSVSETSISALDEVCNGDFSRDEFID